MRKIKTALSIGLASIFLTSSLIAKDPSEKKNDYKIICSGLHVGDADYKITEDNEEYRIIMQGQPAGLFRFLGLEYHFSTEGYKKDNQLYPKKFKRINKRGTSGEDNNKVSEITDIIFDYENLEAKAYAYKEIDGQLIVKYDTRENPVKITEDTKDFLTLTEEISRKDLKDFYEIKTVAKGKLHSFKIRKTGEERIKINNDSYNTIVYETEVTADMFGVDSKAKIWINKDEDHTLLKWWIENGPLWTSVVIIYSGEKSDLNKN